MAKLTNVKVLDAVNGEVFKVEYDGEVYEVIESNNAQKGDIGLRVSRGLRPVTVGSFYEITGNTWGGIDYIDNDGDGAGTIDNYDVFKVFRKQSPKTNRIKVVEKVAETEPEELAEGTLVKSKRHGTIYEVSSRKPSADGEYGTAYSATSGEWFGMEQVNVLSDEEAAEYRREQARAEQPTEQPAETIEKGDLVQVVESPLALPEGSVFRVIRATSDGWVYSDTEDGDGRYIYAPHRVKLIAKAADVYV